MDFSDTFRALGGAAVLGKEVTSEAELVERIEQGLPTASLERLKRYTRLSDRDLTSFLPRRSLVGAAGKEWLSRDLSDRVARAASVAALARRVFGDPDAALEWLRTPNRALDGRVPLALLKTGSGADLVKEVLLRIEHGIYD
ncbi:DUF2384 domain-containing protein [soil metagenome]|nr:DUF2384 domain-containing protein [Gemmatimonadota bacterium]